MEVSGQTRIQASPQTVWEALNNTEILSLSLPECESFVQLGPNRFVAKALVKAGPLRTRAEIEITLSNIHPPQHWVMHIHAKGPIGATTATADMSLAPLGEVSVLSYQARAELGGRLHRFHGAWMDAAAQRGIEVFFKRLSDVLATRPRPTPLLAELSPIPPGLEDKEPSAKGLSLEHEKIPRKSRRKLWIAAAALATAAVGAATMALVRRRN